MNFKCTLKRLLHFLPTAVVQRACRFLLPLARHRLMSSLRLLGLKVSSRKFDSPSPPVDFVRRTALYSKEDLELLSTPEIHEISGLLQISSWCRSVYKSGVTLATAKHILEFGCGCARLVRHLRSLSGVTLFGCDLDGEMVSWCQASFPEIQFFQNNSKPPLKAFAPETIDLIISCSVFTHIDVRNQEAWLAELRRVLKPGGVLLCDVLGLSHARKNLSHFLLQELLQFGVVAVKPDDPEISYSSQVTGQPDVYYSPDEINRRFTQGFIMLGHTSGDLDLLTLKKSASGESGDSMRP